MNHPTQAADADALRAAEEIRAGIKGDVRADQLSRAIYATDASIYEIVPDAVVMPRCVGDVQHIVRACAKHRVPITARGGGTGLTGGAVNRGMIVDFSRHMNRTLEIDAVNRRARVEPGVVLDELNTALLPHGLHFAPDVATSSRATIGGMIANNSCGAHSVMYGRTVDHVRSLDVVLADGSRVEWGAIANSEFRIAKGGDDPSSCCERALVEVAAEYQREIEARFPKVMRRNGGYALDRLKLDDAGRVNTETILCGSEGTLGLVVGATLNLVPLPKHKGMVVAHFHDLLDALGATPATLEHKPAAVELLDYLILDAARANPIMSRRPWLLEGAPKGVLIIELYDEDATQLLQRLTGVAADLKSRGMGYAWPILTTAADQENLWHIRKSGLGLLMSTPGDRQTYDFVEDTAVDPSKLRDYIARFMQVLREEGVPEASYYAHASVGCLHVKPILNLKSAGDIEKMHRIADRISSLALEFGGTMTGEHGDGILRSCWLEKMYGPKIVEAFRKIKTAFDPLNILNPGKIVDPYPMLGHFRYGADYRAADVPTTLDFSQYGGMAGMAEMCSGVGQCRQKLVGTMCPSYMATGDERHTTRSRANALRMALSNRDAIRGLDDPALDDVMDLCISCKACKSECPTGVDMAKLKAEWQWQKIRREGVPLRSRIVANVHRLARLGSLWPGLANALAQNGLMRVLADRLTGFDPRVPPPRFAPMTFRDWFKRRNRKPARDEAGKSVIYFVDTWTNFFTPQVGIAAVQILESLGLKMIVPPTTCCGRPAISKGMLGHARKLAATNIELLAQGTEQGASILTSEPSCYSAIVDEWPQLVRTESARKVAQAARPFVSFVLEAIQASESLRASLRPMAESILLHGHCHQKALYGTADALTLLRIATSGDVREINSGCCGMAGSFGHEREHVEVARLIGEQRLFPAVRQRGASGIAVTGFSCRHQIAHHAGGPSRHVMEIVADAVTGPSQQR
ncbi:MAG TPA: FAD-linked oxidase C-terminal domain-containing protein [Phycisphaerae bacterium]|nr:FAD-linked oxidase C-terminal domain-containing protein [Phycisphaerae bacterium]